MNEEKSVSNSPTNSLDIIVNIKNDNDITRRTSPLKSCSSSASVCRICHEGDQVESLISPCLCSGTLALVHNKCLQNWLCMSNTDFCEICLHQYATKVKSPSISQWLLTNNNGTYGDIICFILLTPLTIFSTYLCILGAKAYFQRGVWEGLGLVLLSIIVLVIYIVWGFIALRYHIRTYFRWRRTRRTVEIITTNNYPPVNNYQ